MNIRYLLLLPLLCCLLCSSVFSAGEDIKPSGLLDFTDKYFGVSVYPDFGDTLPEEDEYYQFDGDASLFAITPDEINDGGLQIKFSLNGTMYPSGQNLTWVTTGFHNTSDNMSYQMEPNTSIRTTSDVTNEIIIQTNSSPIGATGETLSFYLTNVELHFDGLRYDLNDSSYDNYEWFSYYFNGEYKDLNIYVRDLGGMYHEITADELKVTVVNKLGYNLNFRTGILPFDVYGFKIELVMNPLLSFDIPAEVLLPWDDDGTDDYDWTNKVIVGNDGGILTISAIDTTSGFLDSILAGVRNIWSAIANLPMNIVNGLSDILKSLFIPSDSQFVEFKDNFDLFMSNHFGFIYESASVVVELVDTILSSAGEVQSEITVPVFEYTFEDGVVFSFGGQSVRVVPEGFEGVVDVLKFIVNIIVTLGFLNVSMSYYDKFMHR